MTTRNPMPFPHRRFAALLAVAALAACGDDPQNDTPDVIADTSPDAADAVGDVGTDAETDATTDVSTDTPDADAGTDAGEDTDDGDADAMDVTDEPLPVPFDPGPVAEPIVDVPFVQEFNHTTNEVDPRIGPLVDVLIAPTAFVDAGWPEVLQVVETGVVRGLGEPLEIPFIDSDLPPLIGGATFADTIVLITAESVYEVEPNGDNRWWGVPDGVTIERIVPGHDRVWVLTNQGAAPMVPDNEPAWDTDGPHVAAIAENADTVVVALEGALQGWPAGSDLTGSPTWEIINALDPEYEAIVLDVTMPQALDVVALHAGGISGLTVADGEATLVDEPLFASDRVPLRNAVEVLRLGDGGFLAVGSEGAWRMMDRGDGPEWRVYPAERWLPNEDVRGVASLAEDELSTLYFATAGGMGFVTAEYMTLEEKLEPFLDRVVERHNRDGAVSDSHLTVRGDVSSNIAWDSDNDGLWSSYWVVSECARYRETGDATALENMSHTLDNMLSLQTLTGTDYFLARSVIRRDGCQLDDCDDPDDGDWFLSPDEEWWVKADTSNDEVVGHMFMMGFIYDWCATEEQKAAITQHVTRIVRGIIEAGWQLLDIDGERTTHGQFQPEYVRVGLSDAGRRAVAALGMAQLAYHVSGDEWFLEAKQSLIDDHGYAEAAVREADMPARWQEYSGDNNNLATLAWITLIRHETDAALLDLWLAGWGNTFNGLRQQEAAFWHMADHMNGGDTAVVAEQRQMIARWLRLAPVDMIRWSIHGSHRRDLIAAPELYNQDGGGQRSDGRPLPYDERRCDRWNTDQYRIDGGMGGYIEMDGADVTVAYWLARTYGVIVPEE